MTTKSRLVILEKTVIDKKLNRLACQILESHTASSEIQFVGLNERGYQLAKLLIKKMSKLDFAKKLKLFQGHTEHEFVIEKKEELGSKSPIILVDDVLNTGRSIFHLLTILSDVQPDQLEICVLADRHHKKFPIHANYVGLTIATTLQEHIFFDISKPELYLE